MPPVATSHRPARSARSRRTERMAGFWFLTLLVAAAGPLLAVTAYLLDRTSGEAGLLPTLIISPSSARTILSSVAGSLITIASLTASLTIVTLQLLSNQYTPRAVRGFLRRQISQVVSGTFIGIFLYCLLLLVTVRAPGEENDPFVPSLGVLLAVLLALLGLVLLVVFIHTLARTIQVSCMTADLARETLAAVDEVHPAPFTAGGADRPLPEPALELRQGRTGYVQRVDLDALPAGRGGPPGRLDVLVRAGDFVTPEDVVARWSGPGDAPVLSAILEVGHERDVDQDPGFGIRQLVDIALRALSPGINDPTTAVTCLRYLRGIGEELAGRDLAVWRTSRRGSLLVHARAWSLADYLQPLTEVARYASGDARVSVALLETLAGTAAVCARVGDDAGRVLAAGLATDLAAPAIERCATPAERRAVEQARDRCLRPVPGTAPPSTLPGVPGD